METRGIPPVAPASASRGRPRSEEAGRAILRTVAELLAERGLHGLSIEEGGTSRAHPETGAAEALAGPAGTVARQPYHRQSARRHGITMFGWSTGAARPGPARPGPARPLTIPRAQDPFHMRILAIPATA